MNIRKAQQVGESIRTATQVIFENTSKQHMRKDVTVVFQSYNHVDKSFLFRVKSGEYLPFDSQAIAKEIEKILPNVRITEQLTFFFSNSIALVGRELGKRGTYRFDFVDVTP